MDAKNLPRARRLSPQQRLALKTDDGLIDKQLDRLDRILGDVASQLQRSAKMGDVCEEVDDLARHLSAAARMVSRWTRAKRPEPEAEALALLNGAGVQVGWTGDAAECCSLGYPIGVEVVQLVAAIAAQAQRNAPRTRRNAAVASAGAIESICTALRGELGDKASRAVATNLPVSFAAPHATKPSFYRVAATVFEAATENPNANPERAIRKYQELMRHRAAAAAATS